MTHENEVATKALKHIRGKYQLCAVLYAGINVHDTWERSAIGGIIVYDTWEHIAIGGCIVGGTRGRRAIAGIIVYDTWF